MKLNWLVNLSDSEKKHLRILDSGIVSLAEDAEASDQPLYVQAILCRSGQWDGMYGPVEVTQEMLQAIASKYNLERANPVNKNDYVPVTIDHERKADLVFGRVDISRKQLTVIDEVSQSSGETEYLLTGELRIDDDGAKKKVLSGKYAQLSISFNEESKEFYEVSFVAVEAARRSIVLNKGDHKVNLEALQGKVSSLERAAADRNVEIKALGQAMLGNMDKAQSNTNNVINDLGSIVTSLKTASLKGEFGKFVKEGKLSKADFDKLDFNELGSLGETALRAVLSAYSSRPVSADFAQFGVTGSQPIEDAALSDAPSSKEEMARAMKIQLSGDAGDEAKIKKAEEELSGDEDQGLEDGESAAEEMSASFSDVKETIEKLEGLTSKVQEIEELHKSLKDIIGKLNAEKKEGDE